MQKPLSHLPKSKSLIEGYVNDLKDAERALHSAKSFKSHPVMIEIRQRRVQNLKEMVNYLNRYM